MPGEGPNLPAPSSRSQRDRVLLWVAPLILTMVAVTQVLVATISDLTPWRGGGFGMFSTLDSPNQRFLRVAATTSTEGEVLVDLRELFPDDSRGRTEVLKALAQPSRSNLDRLGSTLGSADLVSVDGVAVARDQVSGPYREVGEIQSLRLSVWRPWLDLTTSEMRSELIIQRTVRP